VTQHLVTRMVAERQVERDAVERGFLRQLDGLVVSRGARRKIPSLGGGSADYHAMKIVIVDDQKPRQRRSRGACVSQVPLARSGRN